MAPQTQGADVIEVALPSALHYRHDMIRVPQALTPARFEPPVQHQICAPFSPAALDPQMLTQRIDAAMGTNPLIPLQDEFAQIARLRPQFPLMHAISRAKRI